MVYRRIDIVYGVLITLGDLYRLGYVAPDVKLQDDWDLGDGLWCIRAWHHSWTAEMEEDYPERLPPSLITFNRIRNENKIKKETGGYFPHSYSLVCVCVKCGVIALDINMSNYPTIKEFKNASKAFAQKVPDKLLSLAGPAGIHFIPDDCICCT